MPTIDVDAETASAIHFAANVANVSPQEIVRRLVKLHTTSRGPAADSGPSSAEAQGVPVHIDYEGVRTEGVFDPRTHGLKVTTGRLAEQSWKSPSGAACAVIADLNPKVKPNRNGWSTWIVSETGRLLQSIRGD